MGVLRSSDLWEDETYTQTATDPEPLDLVLFNQTKDAYGAHVGIYLDSRKILHLCRKIGTPLIWEMEDFLKLEEYRVLIGFKRPIKKD